MKKSTILSVTWKNNLQIIGVQYTKDEDCSSIKNYIE